VQFDKLTVRAATELVEVQPNAAFSRSPLSMTLAYKPFSRILLKK
jgi:hypothetical protein